MSSYTARVPRSATRAVARPTVGAADRAEAEVEEMAKAAGQELRRGEAEAVKAGEVPVRPVEVEGLATRAGAAGARKGAESRRGVIAACLANG